MSAAAARTAVEPQRIPQQARASMPPWAIIVTVVIAAVGSTFTLGTRLSAVETAQVAMRERIERAEKDAAEARAALQSIDQRLAKLGEAQARIEGKLEARR